MDLISALMFLCPSAKYSFSGTQINNTWTYDNLVWEDLFLPKPTLIQLEESYIYYQHSLTTGIDYRIERRPFYPSAEDQLDYIYKHGIDAWKLSIDAIKLAFPKV